VKERLPDIKIRPDVAPKLFLERLQQVVLTQGTWVLRNFEEGFGQPHDLFLLLGYHAPDHALAKELIAQFIFKPLKGPARIAVEMKAKSWAGGVATYDSYVGAARLLQPLLSYYNRVYQTRLRLQIQKRAALLPRLSYWPKLFFDQFINMANKSGLHSYDWSRFYDFLIVCQVLRAKLTEDDLVYLLIHAGFDDEYARDIASVYEHGRAILRRHRNPILAIKYARMVARSTD